jgi:hypothetical protein
MGYLPGLLHSTHKNAMRKNAWRVGIRAARLKLGSIIYLVPFAYGQGILGAVALKWR